MWTRSQWFQWLLLEHKVYYNWFIDNTAPEKCFYQFVLAWTELYTHRQSHYSHAIPSNSTISAVRSHSFPCADVHAAPWPAVLSVRKLFRDIEAEMFFLPPAESEDRDRWALWHGRPPGCIHPNGSELHSPLSLPSDQALPVETLSCEVRGHTNSPTPSSFSYTISSISVHHTLIHFPFLSLLSLSLSFSGTLAYWSRGEIISWSALPQLSGPYKDCSW